MMGVRRSWTNGQGRWSERLPNARNALRMAATSMSSCTSGSTDGLQQPERSQEPCIRSRDPCRGRRSALAIDLDRWAIAIASTNRSRRSDGDDHVGRFRGGRRTSGTHRDAHIAEARAGASLIPSPTMIVGEAVVPFRCSRLDLLDRGAFGQDLVQPEGRSHRRRHVGMVPRHHDHAFDSESPHATDHIRRVGTEQGRRSRSHPPPPRPHARNAHEAPRLVTRPRTSTASTGREASGDTNPAVPKATSSAIDAALGSHCPAPRRRPQAG